MATAKGVNNARAIPAVFGRINGRLDELTWRHCGGGVAGEEKGRLLLVSPAAGTLGRLIIDIYLP